MPDRGPKQPPSTKFLDEPALRFERAAKQGGINEEAPRAYQAISSHAGRLIMSGEQPRLSADSQAAALYTTIEHFKKRLSPIAQRKLMVYLVDVLPSEGTDFVANSPVFKATLDSFGTTAIFDHIMEPYQEHFAEHELTTEANFQGFYDQLKLDINEPPKELVELLKALDQEKEDAQNELIDKSQAQENKFRSSDGSEIVEVFKEAIGHGCEKARELLDRVEAQDKLTAGNLLPILEAAIYKEAADFHGIEALNAFLDNVRASQEVRDAVWADWHSRVTHHVADYCAERNYEAAMALIKNCIEDEQIKILVRRAVKQYKKTGRQED